MNALRSLLVIVSFCAGPQAGKAAEPPGPPIDVSARTLADKIRGGLLGQLLGNLNGLRHEMKYIDRPGNVEHYLPALPDGARTDDDTDLEWVYVVAMQREQTVLLPPRPSSGSGPRPRGFSNRLPAGFGDYRACSTADVAGELLAAGLGRRVGRGRRTSCGRRLCRRLRIAARLSPTESPPTRKREVVFRPILT